MEAARLQAAIRAATAAGWLCPDPLSGDTGAALVLHDLDLLDAHLDALGAAFPSSALHAVAVKANPVAGILDHIAARGFGMEAASAGELALALDRTAPGRVVFDSPCKTWTDLRTALQAGVHLNLDSLQELLRVETLAQEQPPTGPVGLRINPDVGAGRIAATSTAVKGSKFGIDLAAHRDAIVAAYARHPWLNALHVHVGSQGCDLDLLVAGAAAVVDLAERIEAAGGHVAILDIGGGLPAGYGEDGDPGPSFEAYAQALRQARPVLFTDRFRLVTEFGRRVHAAAGLALARVEATKVSGGRRIAVTHLGADLFVRAVYRPAQWRHRITVHAPDGSLKQGPRMPWDIVGPLCFSGDRLAKGRQLPALEPGDLVAIHDAGAYTLSMWSRYNSRLAPAVVGLRGAEPTLSLLKPAETIDDLRRFWGA